MSAIDTMRAALADAEREAVAHDYTERGLLAAGRAEGLRDAAVILGASIESHVEVLGRIEAWTHEFGEMLSPRCADTYGDGIRDAKSQVSAMLRAARQ